MKKEDIIEGKRYKINSNFLLKNGEDFISEVGSFLRNKKTVKITLLRISKNSSEHYAISFEGFNHTHGLKEFSFPYSYIQKNHINVFEKYDNVYHEEMEI